MSEYTKMLNGELLDGGDAEITALREQAFEQLKAINALGSTLDSVPLFAKLLNLGQNSYITEDVPPDSLMAGVPARKLLTLLPGEAGNFHSFQE